MEQRQFIEVVLAEAEGRFHYHLPPAFETVRLEPGARLLVPFGTGWKIAYFIRKVDRPEIPTTKGVIAVLDGTSLLRPSLFQLLLWISDYYFSPLGSVIKAALPQGIDAVVRRRFQLSEGGKKMEGQKIAEGQKALIDLLKEGPLTEPLLRKKLSEQAGSKMDSKEKLSRLLSALKKKGWIEAEWEVARPSVQKKIRRIVVLKSTEEAAEEQALSGAAPPSEEGIAAKIASLQARAPRQAEALRTLMSAGGTLPAAAFEGTLQAAVRRLVQKKWIDEIEEETARTPRRSFGFRPKGALLLNAEQRGAVDEIVSALEKGGFSPFLLHGITGSGKTEVYLRVIEQALRRGKGAILLVPEISLTAQLIARFHERFGERIALLHSGLSPGERYDEWCRLREGEARLAIGVRSAIFAPLENPGILIVDEEQDASYKQEEGVRYHARDVAMVRGKAAGAVVVLGSATPSLESFYNSQTGKYRYLRLSGRVDSRPLPPVRLLDLREKGSWIRPYLTGALVSAIEKRLAAGEQALLFLNRRGFSPSLLCGDCGHLPRCVRCSVSLTYHKHLKKLVCHYCAFHAPPPTCCPECQGSRLLYLGIGTEQVEEAIRSLFPAARIARMDRDTTQKKESHQKILAAMAQREIDVLIGTQMVAKGHDFPEVTLVGVLCADLSLQFPDFRSSERTFQLLVQVAGRAGRGSHPGEVLIQTFQPAHESVAAATTHDYSGFYQREIAFRKEMGYPPFSRLILVLLSHPEEAVVADRASAFASFMEEARRRNRAEKGVDLLGPAPAPLPRMKGAYRCQILLKGKERKIVAAVLKEGIAAWERLEQKGVRLEVNVDPQGFV